MNLSSLIGYLFPLESAEGKSARAAKHGHGGAIRAGRPVMATAAAAFEE